MLNIIKINKNYRSTHKPEVSVSRKWGNLLAEAGRFRWVRFAAAGWGGLRIFRGLQRSAGPSLLGQPHRRCPGVWRPNQHFGKSGLKTGSPPRCAERARPSLAAHHHHLPPPAPAPDGLLQPSHLRQLPFKTTFSPDCFKQARKFW